MIPSPRRKTRPILVGGVAIGGDHPVVVQSMTKTDTKAPATTLRQINALAKAGCRLVRVAIRDREGAKSFERIVAKSPLPVIADIHFDPDLAFAALDAGASGIRVNPGTMAKTDDLRRVLKRCAAANTAVRLGINSGSLPKDLNSLFRPDPAAALVEAALRGAAIAQEEGVDNLKVSLKSSSVPITVEAYRRFSQISDLPLHLGITEAGPLVTGTAKSAAGLGILLAEGIGDTIRVSLTASPVREVEVAYAILRSVGLSRYGVDLISCPTCGRCRIDLGSLVSQAQRAFRGISSPVTVAIMGCEVNGPGEAAEADIGFAGGKGSGIIFAQGRVLKRVSQKEAIPALLEALQNLIAQRESSS